ncbi:MAG: beta-propeller fold lactonase family protein, partial [Bryocella sp.]
MHSSPSRAFIGSYTIGTASKGIYTMLLDDDGTTNSIALAAEQKNPSFLCSVPSTRTLYAVEESYGTTGEEGSVWAYQIGTAGALKARTRVGSRGVGPCTLSVDHRQTTLFTANFHSGSLISIRLKSNGDLDGVVSVIQLHGSSVHPQRQRSSHPHAIV